MSGASSSVCARGVQDSASESLCSNSLLSESEKRPLPPPLRLGVAGLGTVGAALCRLIMMRQTQLQQRVGRSVILHSVTARSRQKLRNIPLHDVNWASDPISLAQNPEIDVFVEVIGGAQGPALESIEAALRAGKHVVTANKALLASHGLRLMGLAEEKGVSLNYEAAVAGGIPIVKTMREALAGNQITRVYGILNGTCNYILTRMDQEGLSFETCLKEAQNLGYAESDPRFDVGGNDAAHKLCLLTSLAFGTRIDAESVYTEGIESLTPEDIAAADVLGYKIKLLGVAQKTETGIEQRVHPAMVPKSSAIARIDGVLNAVAVEADCIGAILLVGPGAGGEATASSILSDICDIARGDVIAPLGMHMAALVAPSPAQMRCHAGGYYIRLLVYDRLGSFASLARCMADQGISLKSIVQNQSAPGLGREQGTQLSPKHSTQKSDTQTVILLTHPTTESAIRAAFRAIDKETLLADTPYMIRIEPLSEIVQS